MTRFKSIGTILVIVAIVLVVIMINPLTNRPLETSVAATSQSESESQQETGEYSAGQTIQKASPEDAYVQVDDLLFLLGYRESLLTAVEDISASGRYTVEGYEPDTSSHSAEVSVYKDGQLYFTLRASSIKEYADDSGVSYSAFLFAADEEKNMVLTGISVEQDAMNDAWIFSGNRLDGSNIRKEAFMTRFGSYSPSDTSYPSLVQEKTDAQDCSVYVLSVEVNEPKQEVLSARILSEIHSLRTLQYTFTFDDTTQNCVQVSISSKVRADEIQQYWNKRDEEAQRRTSTAQMSVTSGTGVPTEPAELSESSEISEPAETSEPSGEEETAPEADGGTVEETAEE